MTPPRHLPKVALVSSPKSGPGPRPRYDAAAIEVARQQWGPWCHALTYFNDVAELATEQAVAYLQAGLPAEVVAALIRIRLGLVDPVESIRVAQEQGYCERVRRDAADLLARRVISAKAAAALEAECAARLTALATAAQPLRPAATSAPATAPAREAIPATTPSA